MTAREAPARSRRSRSEVSPSFLVLSHAVIHDGHDVFGPAHNVVEHLSAEGYATDLILHSLNGSGETIHRSFRFAELVDERRFRVRGRGGEVLENIRLLHQIEPTVAVAVDPLNYVGLWLASRGSRSPLSIYYTADYTTRRFANAVLNAAYYGLDRFALRSADVKWSVSRAIAEARAAQGVPESDNLVVQNSPPFDATAIVAWPERNPESLVCVGMLDALLDWTLLLDGIALALPRHPSLSVHLVGDGPESVSLAERAERLGLGNVVQLHGFLAHHDAVAIVARCRVGLALYSGQASWNIFGDSLKVREYFSRGLSVISTATHPLAAELERRGAGVVVATPADVASAIDRLLEPVVGEQAAEAALEMAREADRTSVMSAALDDIRSRLARRQR